MEAADAAGHGEGEPPDLNAVQGNLVGFNKDHQRFLGVTFPDAAAGRGFLLGLVPHIASAAEVREFNDLFREIHGRRGGASDIIQASWTNLLMTNAGLAMLGAPGLEAFPEEFVEGMRARASDNGDVEDSAPENWIAPFSDPQSLHALVVLAADQEDDLTRASDRVAQIAAGHQVQITQTLDGKTRPDAGRGREHFGFKDGISQPGVSGLTDRAKRGGGTIPAGEVLIGHRNLDGVISGQGQAAPQPGEPGYDPSAPPAPTSMPDWTRDGSFAVYRRLRQNVGAFNQFVGTPPAESSLNSEQFGAKLMGRWPSGAPLEGRGSDPVPSSDPGVTDEGEINDFGYAGDRDGNRVPRAAHIRKANPRDSEPPGRDESNRHRILRRGIPYGEDFVENEAPYPNEGAVPDTQDRGLNFLCFQASIADGFEFVQRTWANDPDFPTPGDGHDPIISQKVNPRSFHLPPGDIHLEIARWVQTLGGEYFFAPSIPAIQQLGQGSL